MDNADVIAILQAVSDSRAETLKVIGEVAAHLEGIKSRVDSVEDAQKIADRRTWVHSIILLSLGGLAKILGGKIHWPF